MYNRGRSAKAVEKERVSKLCQMRVLVHPLRSTLHELKWDFLFRGRGNKYIYIYKEAQLPDSLLSESSSLNKVAQISPPIYLRMSQCWT